MALASDFEAVFVSQLLFIRAIRASRGFNSGFRVYAAKLLNRRQKSQKAQNKLVSSFPLSRLPLSGSRFCRFAIPPSSILVFAPSPSAEG
jgi:hypothetical protein